MCRFTLALMMSAGALLLNGLSLGAQSPTEKLYFPPVDAPWETIAPGDAGWHADRLEQLLNWAGEQRSSDVVITLGGRVLAERHYEMVDARDGYLRMRAGETEDGRAIEDVASVQKSVLVFLAGIARGRGLIDFDDPVSKHLGGQCFLRPLC